MFLFDFYKVATTFCFIIKYSFVIKSNSNQTLIDYIICCNIFCLKKGLSIWKNRMLRTWLSKTFIKEFVNFFVNTDMEI